tara:strand:+ start:2468 stop:2977 length:510 start_codon:yes stop_codon:yes gene_type:complete
MRVIRNIFYIISTSSILLFGCSQNNNNIDFDPSQLPKPRILNQSDEKDINSIQIQEKNLISDLVPLKDKEQILAKYKFGKEDPFSEKEIQLNRLNSDFKLTGFLTTNNKKYAFVNYLDNEGTITEELIGGVNTYLLPNGAKVINIDPINKKLIIFHENEKFTFELLNNI